jgi:hypothetical protein
MISSASISGLELRGAGEGMVGFETVVIVSPRQFWFCFSMLYVLQSIYSRTIDAVYAPLLRSCNKGKSANEKIDGGDGGMTERT